MCFLMAYDAPDGASGRFLVSGALSVFKACKTPGASIGRVETNISHDPLSEYVSQRFVMMDRFGCYVFLRLEKVICIDADQCFFYLIHSRTDKVFDRFGNKQIRIKEDLGHQVRESDGIDFYVLTVIGQTLYVTRSGDIGFEFHFPLVDTVYEFLVCLELSELDLFLKVCVSCFMEDGCCDF